MYIILDIQAQLTYISAFESFDSKARLRQTRFPTIYNYLASLVESKKRIQNLIDEFGEAESISISITGSTDYDKQIMTDSAYLHEYNNKDIVKDLKHEFDIPVIIEQDCILDAYAELNNLGENVDEYGLITVTYGIGGVYVKKEDSKYLVFPTELGHTIVVPNGLECACGQRGCVEAYIGGVNMKDRFLTDPKNIEDYRVWEEAVDFLAIATSNFMMAFPTKNIIYSGSSISTIPALKNGIKSGLEKRMRVYKQPKIRVSSLSNQANTLGALKHIELYKNNSLVRL
ncbi:MAG: ROK family protein [Candidatus Dojkabacteria bacterium]|nr:ROK family protein [Candidatus Dojkabacteria bacterium]